MEWIWGLLAVAVIAGVAFWLGRRPGAKAEAEKATAEPARNEEPTLKMLRELLLRREQWLWAGHGEALEAEFDAILNRLLDFAPTLIADDPRSQTTISAVQELLTKATDPAHADAGSLGKARVALEELLMLVSAIVPPSFQSPALDGLRGWHRRLQEVGPLNLRKGDLGGLLRKLGTGEFLHIGGQLHRVTGVHRYFESYEGQDWEWHEAGLERLSDGEVTSADWEFDDTVELYLVQETLRLEDLGFSLARLRDMIEEERGSVTFRGESFQVSGAGEATFYRDSAGKGEPFAYVELESRSGTALALEDWGDEQVAFLSRPVSPDSVRVLGSA